MSLLKRIFGYYNYLPVYLILIFLFNLFFLQLPLLSVFGYEFSATNSILIVLLSGWYFIPLIKKIKTDSKQLKTYAQNFYAAATSLLLVPLLVSLTHSLLTYTCSIKDGLLFYLVITVPSVMIGFAFAVISVSISNRLNRIILILIFLIVLSIPLFEFYFNPQIYFFNPIFGFYPGTIYDEGLSVTTKLAVYRLLNLAYFAMVSYALFKLLAKGMKLKFIALTASFAVAASFIYLSPDFGYSTTFRRLDSELSETAVTEHFIIHYPPELDTKLVKAIAVYHEFDYSELKRFFGYDYPGKINSYLFRSNQQKKNLFGTANADVAKPWMNCDFITYTDYNSTLKHEIAHCYSSVFGSGLFKVAAGLNPYLIEGIAVAADPVYDGNSIDYMASLAFNNGYKLDLNSFYNSLSFYTQASSYSYIYAGSFASFLIKSFGISKFKNFYKSGNFYTSYGTSLKEMLKRYYSTLADSAISEKKDEATYYFGRSSIFYKKCPRFVEDRIRKAWYYFGIKDYDEAERLFREALNASNNYAAIIGYASCLQKTDSLKEAVNFLSENINQFENSAYFYSLELKLGDLYSLDGNFADADSIYGNLILQDPSRTYFYLASLRRDLMTPDSLLAHYLEGNDFDKFFILKEFNSANYNFYSIPVMIDLADSFNENYDLFISTFRKKIDVTDFASSYAMYRLSNYMLAHLDFYNARKMAALALRFKGDDNFESMLKENYYKTNWFYLHRDILNKIRWK